MSIGRCFTFSSGPLGWITTLASSLATHPPRIGDNSKTNHLDFLPSHPIHVFFLIRLKRAYDSASAGDGIRHLVERVWPRGVKKTDLALDGWLKDVAPSTELREWFSHDPEKWAGFKQRYFAELDAHPEFLKSIIDAAHHGTVTLIYSSHDAEHNNAVALKEYLDKKMQK